MTSKVTSNKAASNKVTNKAVFDRIASFLDEYAPHSDHPFIKVDYKAWTRHVYDDLSCLKRKNLPDDDGDLSYFIRQIVINIIFVMTSEVIDGTSAYQDLQDVDEEIFDEMREIYDLI